MNKQDLLREVVVKYIDYFYPVASGTSAVAIDNKIEQAMTSSPRRVKRDSGMPISYTFDVQLYRFYGFFRLNRVKLKISAIVTMMI
ncbi:unnamed protein product [Colias eurytheme]|nr:unnamed protein product [Colias eurytheme]